MVYLVAGILVSLLTFLNFSSGRTTTISNSMARTPATYVTSIVVLLPILVYVFATVLKRCRDITDLVLCLVFSLSVLGVILFMRQSNVSEMEHYSSECSGRIHRTCTALVVILAPLILSTHVSYTPWLLFLHALLVLNTCVFVVLTGTIYTCTEFETYHKRMAVHEYAALFCFMWIVMECS